ncbi:MAG: hypothetical protein K5Q68_08825 [Roseococcus sp.]|nr:hypothetical protein [Roseococcus sp.]
MDRALHRGAGEIRRAREPAERRDRVELRRSAQNLEGPGIGEDGARCLQIRVGDRQGGVEGKAAARIRIATHQEVHADWRIREGARFDILGKGRGRAAGQRNGQRDPPAAARQKRNAASGCGDDPLPLHAETF